MSKIKRKPIDSSINMKLNKDDIFNLLIVEKEEQLEAEIDFLYEKIASLLSVEKEYLITNSSNIHCNIDYELIIIMRNKLIKEILKRERAIKIEKIINVKLNELTTENFKFINYKNRTVLEISIKEDDKDVIKFFKIGNIEKILGIGFRKVINRIHDEVDKIKKEINNYLNKIDRLKEEIENLNNNSRKFKAQFIKQLIDKDHLNQILTIANRKLISK